MRDWGQHKEVGSNRWVNQEKVGDGLVDDEPRRKRCEFERALRGQIGNGKRVEE